MELQAGEACEADGEAASEAASPSLLLALEFARCSVSDTGSRTGRAVHAAVLEAREAVVEPAAICGCAAEPRMHGPLHRC